MERERPASYRDYTWKLVCNYLGSLCTSQISVLIDECGIESDDNTFENQISELTQYGGFLLVRSGLITDPRIALGTVFSLGGLEFVVNHDGVNMITGKSRSARLFIIGGGKSRVFIIPNL